ncbi:MAG TPA: sugar ABC transporter ATP-binding protein [Ignavibacteriaceae bacterium]|nr:sugar ABC transporter ATP-binding protein [Ignavibacteriaceae bacterium]
MSNITKQYPGVLALDNVSFDLNPGEVHCLVGENGAGKSTLMKILSGAVKKDSGRIFINDKEAEINNPSDSQGLGIGLIYQDFKLVPELSAADNIFLGNELSKKLSLLDKNKMNELAAATIDQLGEKIDPSLPVHKLSIAQKQFVEIAKALRRNVKILAMDEPTAPLTNKEIEILFATIKKLKETGTGIIYISHRLEEIFKIGDRVTVLRDGKSAGTFKLNEVDTRELIRLMVGRELSEEFPHHSTFKGEEILKMENLSGGILKNINLEIYKGEVLGLAGLVGSGRSELVRVIFGADKKESGKIFLNGEELNINSPGDAIESGIGLLTEDRNLYGLFMELNIRKNITISNLNNLLTGIFIDEKKEIENSLQFFQNLKIKAPSTETKVETLSGGNRQKVVLARWLFSNSRVLIFDEPTAGIDIGVKYEIYNLINKLVEDGIGVTVISSDLPELMGVSDRIAVMCNGRITGILNKQEFNQEKILTLATKFLE